MSMSLEYKFTFINVLEEVDEERSLATFRRSSSLPPRPKPEMCSEILSTEEQDGRYVQTLTEKLPGIFGAKAATEDLTSSSSSRQDTGVESWSTVGLRDGSRESLHDSSRESGEEESDGSNVSSAYNPGSVGHPELCRRPCIYFAAGQCRNSADCNFCHLSHAHRSATLDKNQRQTIKELSKQEFLSVLLRCLRNKAVQGSFEDEAQELLELFEERLRQEGVPAEASKGLAKISNLERALNRMTFFSVASLTTRAQFEKEFLDRCKKTVGKLRQYFD
ncbi:unnamed protein product [Durusdinium trenchii]|uniref:C3H1-type domain-containing protein n=1 Tax=Durusdinium trenchii TaxID=1381693 RepID=A0ABP0LM41_9DINO